MEIKATHKKTGKIIDVCRLHFNENKLSMIMDWEERIYFPIEVNLEIKE